MSRIEQQCSNCQAWHPITAEGAPGTPKRACVGDRENWGQCCSQALNLVRIKGYLETYAKHWCTAYVPTANAANAEHGSVMQGPQ